MKQFLKKSALRSASCLQAVAVIGTVTVGAIALSTPAFAQDYTSGSVGGTVVDESGAPVSGATVTLVSNEQGFSRTAGTGGNGTFRFVSLPPGSYTVTVSASGKDAFTANNVRVAASQTADLDIGLTSTGSEIIVTGAQIQTPFTGTTSGVTVDVEELTKRVPVGRDVTNLMLLAPGTNRGESIFGGKAANFVSINGSSVAENAYYINGLNITNFDNYLGGANVPFDFYQSVEVKSGGYSAEFGRATGGIVNAVSKSGGNDFEAAIHLNWAPDWLRSTNVDQQFCEYDDPVYPVVGEFHCQNFTSRKNDYNESYSAIMEASGPIIKDRLFVYGLLEMRRNKTIVVDSNSGLAVQRESDDPFWAVKVDAFPLDDHHLEFTIFDARNSEIQSNRDYSEDTDGNPTFGPSLLTLSNNTGGVNYVGKYTGRFTDWLTLSAAYGRMRDRFDSTPVDLNAGLFYSNSSSGGTIAGVPNGAFFNGQTELILDGPYATERKFWRADADLFFNAFGDHHIRLGYDQENNTLNHVASTPGKAIQCDSGFLSTEACTAGAAGGAGVRFIYLPALTQATADATGVDPAFVGSGVVQVEYYNSGGLYDAQNCSFYIQDEWNVTDRLTFNLGLRRDDFKLDKADGSNLVDLDKNYAPRIGATYDLFEDHSGKFKAFWGQYYLPVASNSSFRQASPELYFREREFYDTVDGQGLPHVIGQYLPDPGTSSYTGNCPFGLLSSSTGTNCSVTGDGTVPDTSAAIAHNLKATRESEWIVGYEQQFGLWTAGITYTHRNLDRSAEDMAIDRAVLNYCDDNGLTGCSDTWSGFNQYVIANPGSDLVVNLRGQDAREVTFTKEELAAIGFPKAKRTYDAVELAVARAWDGKWSFNANYTWSKSKGNSEGFVQSDFQQDDAGITQDFDQPGFLDGAYGYLPNDRRHRLKAWGSFGVTDDFILGSNVSIESPRHLSCFGFHPGSAVTDGSFENAYDQASHYCGGVLSPRGTAQQSEWVYQVDLSARYNVHMPTGQLVTFRVDVFNAFNSHAVEDRYEIGDLDDTFLADPTFGQPRLYQSPRSIRLGADISF